MPAGRRQQNNAMLYTVATFVALFLIATTIAVIFYVRAQDFHEQAQEAIAQRDELATTQQWRERGNLVGDIEPRQTYLGQMIEYLDQTTYMILGGVPEEDRSAEIKVEMANNQTRQALQQLVPDYIEEEVADANTTGLVPVINDLRGQLDNISRTAENRQGQLDELQARFDDAMQTTREKERRLLSEKEQYVAVVNKIRDDYARLEELLEQTTERQVQILRDDLEEVQERERQLNQDLMRTEAELEVSRERMEDALGQLREVMPTPDPAMAAYEPDGSVILIGERQDVIYLNLGSEDRVYQGLTFSVYHKNIPIPRDGQGKAEVEIFNVRENTSIARVVSQTEPIIEGDIVANLVWHRDRENHFVVAGDFDLNSDGRIDDDGLDKVKALIARWGGQLEDDISARTDFVVLGEQPTVRSRPTFEEISIDPLAMERYERSVERRENYEQIKRRAEVLSVPVFNTERFLHFIGYKALAQQPGAF